LPVVDAHVGASAEALDTTASIETPEHIAFRFRLGGPARRAAAYTIDTIVRGAILTVIVILAGLASIVTDSELSGWKVGALFIAAFVIEWGYFVACEMLLNGGSLGKRALGLRVVTREGLPISFGDSVLRNLLRAADFLPSAYALGFVTMIADKSFRRLGDLAAGTIVILEEKTVLRQPIRLHPPPTEEELAGFPPVIDLPVSALEALELFLAREPQLAPLRGEELASLLAPRYAKRFGVRYRNAARFLGLVYHRATSGGSRAR
jgi:uncharacterized RDD family membrane protein YckC